MIFRLWTTFLLALLGACAAAWLAAIDIHEKYKAARRRMKSRFGFAKACERLLRAPLYRRLRKAVRAAKGVPA